MSCKIITGLNATLCRTNAGGIKRFLIANFEDISGVTEASSLVSDITMVSGTTFKVFTPNRDTSNWTQPSVGGSSSGSLGYEPTAKMVFSKVESDDINTIKLLSRAKIMIIVQGRNGIYYLLGHTEGLELLSNNFDSGIATGDANAFTLEFKGSEMELAPQVDETIIAGLLI